MNIGGSDYFIIKVTFTNILYSTITCRNRDLCFILKKIKTLIGQLIFELGLESVSELISS